MAKQRNGDWGFPVGIKAAADWQNCGTPTTAQGFDAGEELECSSATCMLKCPAGQYAIGRRRIRCRWKRKHGKKASQFFTASHISGLSGELHVTNDVFLVSLVVHVDSLLRDFLLRVNL